MNSGQHHDTSASELAEDIPLPPVSPNPSKHTVRQMAEVALVGYEFLQAYLLQASADLAPAPPGWGEPGPDGETAEAAASRWTSAAVPRQPEATLFPSLASNSVVDDLLLPAAHVKASERADEAAAVLARTARNWAPAVVDLIDGLAGHLLNSRRDRSTAEQIDWPAVHRATTSDAQALLAAMCPARHWQRAVHVLTERIQPPGQPGNGGDENAAMTHRARIRGNATRFPVPAIHVSAALAGALFRQRTLVPDQAAVMRLVWAEIDNLRDTLAGS